MAVDDPDYLEILIHTCTIQRKGTGSTDESGAKVGAWTNLATGVACLLEDKSILDDQVQVTSSAKGVFVEALLFLPGDRDITENDRVASIVRTSDSATIQSGPLYVLEINRIDDPDEGDEHHVEVLLSRMAP